MEKLSYTKMRSRGIEKRSLRALTVRGIVSSSALCVPLFTLVDDFLVFLSMRIRADEPYEGCAIHTA